MVAIAGRLIDEQVNIADWLITY